MGFSALDGVPMATRCGALDPGVVLHFIMQKGMSPADVEDLLYRHSGLLGISGISVDSRELIESASPEAGEALELFCFRIAGETARLAATLGGLDAIVFTAGVGDALKIAGTDAGQASGALLQLSQALGSAVVRAEEFNSINEGARPILQAAGKGYAGAEGSVA